MVSVSRKKKKVPKSFEQATRILLEWQFEQNLKEKIDGFYQKKLKELDQEIAQLEIENNNKNLNK
jgi:hypothetical protein